MDYVDEQIAQAEAACYGTAVKNGHTPEEADLCDDGSVGCPDCPFVARANTACTRLETGAANTDSESNPAVSSG